jgi:hypothetical protein
MAFRDVGSIRLLRTGTRGNPLTNSEIIGFLWRTLLCGLRFTFVVISSLGQHEFCELYILSSVADKLKIKVRVNYVEEGQNIRVVVQLRRLVTSLSPCTPGFAPGSFNVGFLMGKVTLGQVSLRFLQFSPVNSFPPVLHTSILSGG